MFSSHSKSIENFLSHCVGWSHIHPEFEGSTEEKSLRVDLELESDHDESENSSDSDDENSDSGDSLIKENTAKKTEHPCLTDHRDKPVHKSSKSAKELHKDDGTPTIQMKLTLGAFRKNPLISLLDDDSDSDTNDKGDSEECNHDDEEQHEKHSTISNMLTSGKRKRPEQRPKGPLITEIP